MIEAWTWPAYVAVLLGGALFAVLFGPLLALQSRRFGRLTLSRTIAVAMFSVYGVALVSYTLLPLPERDWCSVHPSPAAQLRPFHSVDDIVNAGSSTSFAILQVVFNVALFVPWGAFVRRYFGWSILTATSSGFAVSLLIESTQGTGVWGLHGGAYRVADIDDLITNTSGALIGALVAPVLVGWIPPARDDREHRGDPRPVSLTRRLAAGAVDLIAVAITTFVLTVTYRAIRLYGLEQPLPEPTDWTYQVPWLVLALVLVLVLPVLFDRPTPGQQAMWLAASYPDDQLWRRWVRLCTGVGGWTLLWLVQALPPTIEAGTADAAEWAGRAWVIVSIVAIAGDRTRRGISFRLAGAGIVDSRGDMMD